MDEMQRWLLKPVSELCGTNKHFSMPVDEGSDAERSEIVGILKQFKETMEGEVGESTAMMKEDFDDTSKALPKDLMSLADLGNSCAAREAEFEEKKQSHTEEMVAFADTIKSLNNDEALGAGSSTALVQDDVSFNSYMQQPSVSQRGKSSGAGGSIINILEVDESDFADNLSKVETEEADSADEYEQVD